MPADPCPSGSDVRSGKRPVRPRTGRQRAHGRGQQEMMPSRSSMDDQEGNVQGRHNRGVKWVFDQGAQLNLHRGIRVRRQVVVVTAGIRPPIAAIVSVWHVSAPGSERPGGPAKWREAPSGRRRGDSGHCARRGKCDGSRAASTRISARTRAGKSLATWAARLPPSEWPTSVTDVTSSWTQTLSTHRAKSTIVTIPGGNGVPPDPGEVQCDAPIVATQSGTACSTRVPCSHPSRARTAVSQQRRQARRSSHRYRK